MDFNILIKNNLEINSVLDLGAHAGTFTFECKKFFPNAYYFMIDGNPISEQYIRNSGIDYKIVYLSDTVKDTVVYKTTYNSFNTGVKGIKVSTIFVAYSVLLYFAQFPEALLQILASNMSFVAPAMV